jgi:hypothetical protein
VPGWPATDAAAGQQSSSHYNVNELLAWGDEVMVLQPACETNKAEWLLENRPAGWKMWLVMLC